MILRLLRRQARHRRQHAEGVGGEENHFLRVARFRYRTHDIVDMIDRVGDAGVLGLAVVVIIDAAVFAHHDVLQQRIAADSAIDFRLRLLREFDGLGVAAAFKVENAVVVPAVLVVANQLAFRIGGKRGFAGAGKTEEYRDVARFADVGRAVHRGDAAQRQQIVHHREQPFLHLAAVPGAADQLHPFGQVERHEVFRV